VCPRHVLRPHARSQAIGRVIGQLDGLLLRLEGVEDHDGAEDFLLSVTKQPTEGSLHLTLQSGIRSIIHSALPIPTCLCDAHAGRHVPNHGGLIVVALGQLGRQIRWTSATRQHLNTTSTRPSSHHQYSATNGCYTVPMYLGTFVPCDLHVVLDAIELRLAYHDHRPSHTHQITIVSFDKVICLESLAHL
jgi:hypothetical protein